MNNQNITESEIIKQMMASYHQAFITEIKSDKVVRCNFYYDKEENAFFPVIDPNGKAFISLEEFVSE